jgi:DNA replication protein DnaC
LSQPNLWPKDFQGPQIDLNWHPSLKGAVNQVIAWHNKPVGGLVLAGGYGCGKTTIARIALHAVGGPVSVIDWESGQPQSVRTATFYGEPDLLEAIRESYSGNGETGILSYCQRAKLLILDDIGAGYVKEESQRWYEDILWRILNERNDKKTLVTTNLTPPELQARIGGRAWSRLKEMLGSSENYVSLFDVPDYRGKDW